jgi:hypothetical protein
LVCKRHLDIMHRTINHWIGRKLKTSMKKKNIFLNSWYPTQRMVILAYTTNAGMRHDGLHKPNCIYLRRAIAHFVNGFTTLD